MKQWWIWLAGGLALVVLLFLVLRSGPEPEPVVEQPVEDATPAQPLPPSEEEPVALETPGIEPPAEPAIPPPPPLPDLDESDPEVANALGEAFGEDPVARLLVDSQLVRKLVVTVDNLPREKISMRLRAVKSAPGRFEPGGTIDGPMLTEANYGRYAPYVELVNATDAAGAVALYQYYYPLLQEAYEELGYPESVFNDRVIEVIDDLLAAPEINRPVRLTRPHVLYKFEDQRLEALSAGQKMMIRMGPSNASVVKAKLREIRERLAGWTPPDPLPDEPADAGDPAADEGTSDSGERS
jgi:hypothetical protein